MSFDQLKSDSLKGLEKDIHHSEQVTSKYIFLSIFSLVHLFEASHSCKTLKRKTIETMTFQFQQFYSSSYLHSNQASTQHQQNRFGTPSRNLPHGTSPSWFEMLQGCRTRPHGHCKAYQWHFRCTQFSRISLRHGYQHLLCLERYQRKEKEQETSAKTMSKQPTQPRNNLNIIPNSQTPVRKFVGIILSVRPCLKTDV